MEQFHVRFPGLGLEFDINRIAFQLGDFKVYWYGLIIMTGLLLAVLYAWRSAERYKVNFNKLFNCILAGLVCGIVGARLYFCLFKWDYYGSHPIEILHINNGGLAIYGGIIAGLITVFVPDDFFLRFADTPILSMLVMLAISIPMYVCATGSIPIAVALMLKGITPGAALVLLMAGPASNMASILVIRKVLGRKTLWLYLLSITLGAFAFGLGVRDFLIPVVKELGAIGVG